MSKLVFCTIFYGGAFSWGQLRVAYKSAEGTPKSKLSQLKIVQSTFKTNAIYKKNVFHIFHIIVLSLVYLL